MNKDIHILFGLRIKELRVRAHISQEELSFRSGLSKNYISDDFLIRQLYYPYRLWSNKVTKRVRPIFLTYSNGIFHLREYEFTTPELYNSIHLIRHKKYAIQEGAINIENIQNILKKMQH